MPNLIKKKSVLYFISFDIKIHLCQGLNWYLLIVFRSNVLLK